MERSFSLRLDAQDTFIKANGRKIDKRRLSHEGLYKNCKAKGSKHEDHAVALDQESEATDTESAAPDPTIDLPGEDYMPKV
jgi:hypothetical protein